MLFAPDNWTESCRDGITEGVETYAKQTALLGEVVREIPTCPKCVEMTVLIPEVVSSGNIVLVR